MKKLLTLILTLVLVVSTAALFVACDDSSDSTETGFTFTYVSGDDEHYIVDGLEISEDDSENVDEDDFVVEYEGVKIIENHTLYLDRFTTKKYKNKDVAITEIGISALANRKFITKIVVGSNITVIGEGAFSGCTSLEEIELPFVGSKVDAVNDARIFAYIFGTTSNDEDLETSIETASNVSSGAESATYYVPNSLKKITINNDSMTRVEECTFYGLSMVEEINLPSTIGTIGKKAFYNCSALNTIDIDNVSTIYDEAFYGCSRLNSVKMGSVVTIGASAFAECSNLCYSVIDADIALSTLNFASTLTTIGENAFECCSSIKCVVFNSNVTLAPYAFSNCSSLVLAKRNKFTITEAATAFDGCDDNFAYDSAV